MRLIITVTCLLWCLDSAASAAPRSPLRLVQSIALSGVEGRIDHMALNANGQLLFVVALGNNSVEVLDLRSGRRVRSITGFREPQGIGFVASPPRLFVASGGDGSVSMLDADSFRVLRTIPLGDDADNVCVDSAGSRVYVGFGSGGLATLDAATGGCFSRCRTAPHSQRKFEYSRSHNSH